MTTPLFQLMDDVRVQLHGYPAVLTGSSVALRTYGLKPSPITDLDVFTYTGEALMAAAAVLLQSPAFTLDERNRALHWRWMRYGLKGWHTQSLKLSHVSGHEVNLVFKTLGNRPTASALQVIETFDYGFLAQGYDLSLETGQLTDLRTAFFPGQDLNQLPLLPLRGQSWVKGLFMEHQGLKALSRYTRYAGYGFDMELVRQQLMQGYIQAAAFYQTSANVDKQRLGLIYETTATLLRQNDLAQLEAAGKAVPKKDQLEELLDTLQDLL